MSEEIEESKTVETTEEQKVSFFGRRRKALKEILTFSSDCLLAS